MFIFLLFVVCLKKKQKKKMEKSAVRNEDQDFPRRWRKIVFFLEL